MGFPAPSELTTEAGQTTTNASTRPRYGIVLTNELPKGPFDAVILAVKHDPIAKLGETGIKAVLAPGGVIYDLKGILPPGVSHARI